MKKCAVIVIGCALLSMLCALWPEFAATAALLSRAVAEALSRLNAACGAPIALVALIALALFVRPRALFAGCTALAMFCLTWVPALCAAPSDVPNAPPSALAALCETLVDELNASGRSVTSPEAALLVARDAMRAGAAPRASLAPGLMRRLNLAGIYIPVTGEAIIDLTRPEAGLIFTAAHELAHMRGIAHETYANIAAYDACIAHGGAAAYSARLWALRYAIARLGDDWQWTQGLRAEIRRDLALIPYAAGGECDYAALADYLALR